MVYTLLIGSIIFFYEGTLTPCLPCTQMVILFCTRPVRDLSTTLKTLLAPESKVTGAHNDNDTLANCNKVEHVKI